MVTHSLVIIGLSIVGAAASAAPPELNYVLEETREATRAATLANYGPTVDWSAWRVIGPFDNTGRNKHAVIYPPEIEVDLEAVYVGKGGAKASWRTLPAQGWDALDLRVFGGSGDEDAICYLVREAVCSGDTTITFDMGSDDGLILWLNGRVLVDADEYRGLDVQSHTVELPFHAGRNQLLVKVTQGAVSWQFQMVPRQDARLLAMLDYQLDRDFPPSDEARHYRILTIIEPAEIVLEVGGLDVTSDGRPIVATRRGDLWIVEGAWDEPPFDCTFIHYAGGLHEPLGLRWIDGAAYTVQRAELTRLRDTDGDDRADLYETVCDSWGVSGNYHEFAYGPKLDGAGRLWVTLNLGYCGGLGKSSVPWRGWAVTIGLDGSLTPVCGGLRSPNGLGANASGDMFFTDNQGEWVGTCKLSHLAPGDWHGHPSGEDWYVRAGMRPWRGEEDFKPPAVWFPYGRMGQSASDILLDDTGGKFGPFSGQLFVGDQTNATVMRVFLEKVQGAWQGASFPFRTGFDCGVNRMCFGPDGSMLVGLTNRGWGSLGRRPWGLQRLAYTGVEPFEVLSMEAKPDGFLLTFTEPVDPATATDSASWSMRSFTYLRHAQYGSPEVEGRDLAVRRADVAADGRSVRLRVDGLRPRFVCELHAGGVRNLRGEPLLHAEAYYTLNAVPK